MAEIPRQRQYFESSIVSSRLQEQADTSVTTSVVHQNDFAPSRHPIEQSPDFVDQKWDRFLLVINRDYQREQSRRITRNQDVERFAHTQEVLSAESPTFHIAENA